MNRQLGLQLKHPAEALPSPKSADAGRHGLEGRLLRGGGSEMC